MSLNNPTQGKLHVRIAAGLIAAAGWFALALQLWLLLSQLDEHGRTIGEALIRYFSYFTILTNIFAACVMTAIAAQSRRWQTLRSDDARTAAAVYIVIVGLVYALILRSLWHPEGWQSLADTLLHDLVPAAVVLHWLMQGTREALPWSRALAWLGFPIAYTVIVMARGAASGFYPYPFLDPAIGLGRLAANALLLLGVLLGAGLAFIALSRFRAARRLTITG